MARNHQCFNYVKPSFIEGMARIFDFAGALDYHPRPNPASKPGWEKDADAIRSDWEAVGQYIWDAIGQFEEAERDNLDKTRRRQCANQTK